MLTNFSFNLFIAYSCRIPNNLPSYSPHLTHTWVVLNHFVQLPRLVHKLTIFVAIKSAFQLLQFPFELATLASPPSPSPWAPVPAVPFVTRPIYGCCTFHLFAFSKQWKDKREEKLRNELGTEKCNQLFFRQNFRKFLGCKTSSQVSHYLLQSIDKVATPVTPCNIENMW